jgi:Domain of unknown function (DUF4112)
MAQEPPRDIPVDEVLPPGTAGPVPIDAKDPEASEASRILAKWLDNWIRIPGTDFRIGLDPIVSIFPGVGDFFASSAGLVILLEGIRLRVSVFVLAHMGMNLLLNAVMNLVPGAGFLASALYKSNSRNLTLLRKWQEGHAKETKRTSITFFIFLVLIFLVIVALWVSLWIGIIWAVRKTLFAWL